MDIFEPGTRINQRPVTLHSIYSINYLCHTGYVIRLRLLTLKDYLCLRLLSILLYPDLYKEALSNAAIRPTLSYPCKSSEEFVTQKTDKAIVRAHVQWIDVLHITASEMGIVGVYVLRHKHVFTLQVSRERRQRNRTQQEAQLSPRDRAMRRVS